MFTNYIQSSYILFSKILNSIFYTYSIVIIELCYSFIYYNDELKVQVNINLSRKMHYMNDIMTHCTSLIEVTRINACVYVFHKKIFVFFPDVLTEVKFSKNDQYKNYLTQNCWNYGLVICTYIFNFVWSSLQEGEMYT